MSTAPILYTTDGVEDFALDPIEQAIADIAAGRPVVVVDDEDRENEGDLIFAASKATPELMAFTIRHSSGVISGMPSRSRVSATIGTQMTPEL